MVTFRTASSGNATFAQDNGAVTFSEFEQFWTHEGRDTVTGANADVGVGATGIWFNTRWGDDILTGTNGRDTLEGGDHADTINGGRGDDIISMFEEAYHADGSRVVPDAHRDGAGDRGRCRHRPRPRLPGRRCERPPGRPLNVSNLHDAQGNRVDVNDVVVGLQGSNVVLIFRMASVILEGVSPSTLTRATLIEMGIPCRPPRPRMPRRPRKPPISAPRRWRARALSNPPRSLRTTIWRSLVATWSRRNSCLSLTCRT